jgi:hypothetical protein
MTERIYRLLCAALAGAQIFFVAVAAQTVFSREVSGLPREDPRRQLAADAVGAMLGRLDAATIVICAAAVLLSRRRAALLPLFAGLCALASALWVTPAIHAMRQAGEVASPRFGVLHAVSSVLLLVEIVLLAVAAWTAPESASTPLPAR